MEERIVIRAYKMTSDTGFAPNPFHGYLTLATCKPGIRLKTKVGEWICGFDSKELSGSPVGEERLVYAMKIEEKLTFDEYYEDPRFQKKKPRSGKLFREGDNILYHGERVGEHGYHRKEEEWSHDLKGKYVLVSQEFWYFGKCAIKVSKEVKPYVPKTSTYYGVITSGSSAKKFIDWLIKNFPKPGIYGPPHKCKCDSWQEDENFVTALCL